MALTEEKKTELLNKLVERLDYTWGTYENTDLKRALDECFGIVRGFTLAVDTLYGEDVLYTEVGDIWNEYRVKRYHTKLGIYKGE